jgi:hypothetical protein
MPAPVAVTRMRRGTRKNAMDEIPETLAGRMGLEPGRNHGIGGESS